MAAHLLVDKAVVVRVQLAEERLEGRIVDVVVGDVGLRGIGSLGLGLAADDASSRGAEESSRVESSRVESSRAPEGSAVGGSRKYERRRAVRVVGPARLGTHVASCSATMSTNASVVKPEGPQRSRVPWPLTIIVWITFRSVAVKLARY